MNPHLGFIRPRLGVSMETAYWIVCKLDRSKFDRSIEFDRSKLDRSKLDRSIEFDRSKLDRAS